MNALRLSSTAPAADGSSGHHGDEPPPLRYWVKAGAGFTIGAGAVYIAGQIAWVVIITEFPMLWFLHGITRF